MSAETEARTYGNWRRPATPGMLGLGPIGTGVFLAGVIVAFVAGATGGLVAAAVVLLLLAAGLVPLLLKDQAGRNVYTRAAARRSFLRSRRKGTDHYLPALLGDPGDPLHSQPNRLPGLLALSELRGVQDQHGSPVAIIKVPQTQHFSVVLHADPEAGSLVDADAVDAWVSRWGQFLADLGHEPHLAAASVTVDTAPDTGEKLTEEVARLTSPFAPDLARDMLQEAAATWPAGAASTSTWISLTWCQRQSEMGKPLAEDRLVQLILDRLPGLCGQLQAAGCGDVRPMSPAEVTALVSSAYSPDTFFAFEELAAKGELAPIPWADCGPSMMRVGWSHIHHDDAYSRVWRMTAAPTSPVPAVTLASLLNAHQKLPRKRVTLLYRPHDAASAARIADADLRTAKVKAETRKGEVRAGEALAVEQARQTAADQAAGAGLVRFSMLVTVTVTDKAGLDEISHVVDQLGAASRVRLRPASGTQAPTFAAGLGIGLVLQSHVRLPAFFKENL